MNKIGKTFKELAAQARKGHKYFLQSAIIEFTEDVVRGMAGKGMTKADLAKALGSSPAYVTKMLGGQTNFTLETMVKLAMALGARVRVHLQPEGSFTRWFDVLESPPRDAAAPCQHIEWVQVCGERRQLSLKVLNEELAASA